ncbi:sensor histidine kinase [Nonomuraea sp. NPDC050556]|uniref:sensor histidine kinase n=1 Tax=Nonomuraea sp. NPDC050556 TaxID=3364369 RepID=UPI0037A4EDAF
MRVDVRVRLTMLFGGLFLLAATAPIVVNLVVTKHSINVIDMRTSGPVPMISGVRAQGTLALEDQLLGTSIAVFAITALLGVSASWLIAGRVLRPLRRMTATARRLTTRNLDERIAMTGRQDELKELADTFDAMLDRLADAFDAQRRFAANASHELRTPLALQRAAVEVALADPHPTVASLTTMAARVHSATLRHEHLVDGLLMLARSERLEHLEEVDLAASARDAIIAVHPHVEQLGIRVTSRLRRAALDGDPDLIDRLAANLVHNAAHHNRKGGTIHVETGADGDRATLRVRNTGPVVPRRGHGLGLSIVGAIAEAHGGAFDARPGEQGGLDVLVTLPRSEALREVEEAVGVAG